MGKVRKSQRAGVADFAGADVNVTVPVIDLPVMTAASMAEAADPIPDDSEWLVGGIKQGFLVRSNSDGWSDTPQSDHAKCAAWELCQSVRADKDRVFHCWSHCSGWRSCSLFSMGCST
jgi:hypothetical protein